MASKGTPHTCACGRVAGVAATATATAGKFLEAGPLGRHGLGLGLGSEVQEHVPGVSAGRNNVICSEASGGPRACISDLGGGAVTC